MNKTDLNALPLVMSGPGRIDDSKAIDLNDYMQPFTSFPKGSYPVKLLPRRKNFSMKIGGTTFDVTTHFSDDGRQSVLQQFQDLILSEHLI